MKPSPEPARRVAPTRWEALTALRRAEKPKHIAVWNEARAAGLPAHVSRDISLSNRFLEKADFRGGELEGFHFSGARMRDANLTDADLRGADFYEAKDLKAAQFAGTDLTDAKNLPPEISDFSGLETVKVVSVTARHIFLLTLFVSGYSLLITMSTSQADLLLGSGTTKMPILGTSIPSVLAYIATPVLLACLYCYLHISLAKMWEELSLLPAVFPDGRRLDAKAHPWLLLSLTTKYLPRLRRGRPTLWWLQLGASFLLAWCAVPFTLLAFCARYLVARDWVLTGFHIGLLVVVGVAGAQFFLSAKATLRSHVRLGTAPSARQRRWVRSALLTACFLPLALALIGASWASIHGVPRGAAVTKACKEDLFSVFGVVPQVGVPRMLARLRFSVFADFEGREISQVGRSTSREDEPREYVIGAQLEGADLRFMKAGGAFLVNAHMKEATLLGADLGNAELRGADLRNAALHGAVLDGADLRNINGNGAHLEGAFLREARIGGADLRNADLRKADLRKADLANANLTGADLRGANLGAVRNWKRIESLTGAQIKGIRDAPPGFREWALDNGAVE